MSKPQTWTSVAPWAAFVFYLAVALEVIIMISPFAAYFYAIYAPILEWLETRPDTAWLTAFFLPHISYSGDPLLTILAYLGPILLGLGLAVFLVCAVQIYSAKLFRRGVVTGGLYRWVRHPQYAGLAVAGLGLLLYWPRFIIVVFYVVMLFLYNLLARHEEGRLAQRYGDAYLAYGRSLPMFVPGWPAGRQPASSMSLILLFLGSLVAAVALGTALRGYAQERLTTALEGNVLALSLSGGEETALRTRIEAALADAEVSARLSEHPREHTLVAYVLPQEYMMQHLVADLGEHEAHHSGGDDNGALVVVRHLAEMYGLKPLRQLQAGAASPQQRVIFTEATTALGRPVAPDRALAADVRRLPLFFVDLEGRQVVMTMATPPRHGWGAIPVPAF